MFFFGKHEKYSAPYIKYMEFPYLIAASNENLTSLVDFVSENRRRLIARVRAHGAVLLRGWTPDVVEFSQITRQLGQAHPDMSCSAGPRIEIVPGVHTANEAPPSEEIPFHHEMAQCPSPPEFVLFYCDVPPAAGGATPVIRSRLLVAELTRTFPQVAQEIRDRGIRYVRELPPATDMTSPLGKSWRDTLNVATRAQAEDVLRARGFEWEWLSRDRLKTIGPSVPMFVERDGEETLFTAAESVFLENVQEGRPEKSFVYGDGRPLEEDAKRAFVALGRFAFNNCVRIPWMRGDILVINNATVMHARDRFEPPRRILVSLIGCLEDHVRTSAADTSD